MNRVSTFFVLLVFGFFQFEKHVFAEFLVVLAEFEFDSWCEIFLLHVGNISHNP